MRLPPSRRLLKAADGPGLRALVVGVLELFDQLFAGLLYLVGLFDEGVGVDVEAGDGGDAALKDDACGLGVGELRVGLDDEADRVEADFAGLRQ